MHGCAGNARMHARMDPEMDSDGMAQCCMCSANTVRHAGHALVAACELYACQHSKNETLRGPVHLCGPAVGLQRPPQCQIFVGLQHIHVSDMSQQSQLALRPAVECQSAKHTEVPRYALHSLAVESHICEERGMSYDRMRHSASTDVWHAHVLSVRSSLRCGGQPCCHEG